MSGLSSVPVCWIKPRLAREPKVDPLCVTSEAGVTAFDCREDDWVAVAVGVFASAGVDVPVAVIVGEGNVPVGVRV